MTDRSLSHAGAAPAKSWIAKAAPVLFVLLWATGFIFAKIGLAYAEPMTLLAVRFSIVIAILLPVSLAMRAPWPRSWAEAGHIAITGLLIHAAYLVGVFVAIDRNMPPGLAALVVSGQPLLTAFLVGPLLGERLRSRQMIGMALGFGGVALVLAFRFTPSDPVLLFRDFGLGPLLLAVLSLVGITLGVLYQKRFCPGFDLHTGTVVQFVAAGALMWLLALFLETNQVEWTWALAGALAWLTVPMSIGAIFLLSLLIRIGAASKTVSLFYLVPPVTALLAFAFFGDTLGWGAFLGMALTAVGVALVMQEQR